MKWIVAITLGLASTGSIAHAQGAGQVGAAKPEANKDLICLREAPTGTRFAQRICVRRTDAEKRTNTDQADMLEKMNGPRLNPASNGG